MKKPIIWILVAAALVVAAILYYIEIYKERNVKTSSNSSATGFDLSRAYSDSTTPNIAASSGTQNVVAVKEIANIGTIVDEVRQYTTTQVIDLSNALSFVFENTGTTDTTFVYGTVLSKIKPGEQVTETRAFDEITNKYSKFASLELNATATAPIKIVKQLFQ